MKTLEVKSQKLMVFFTLFFVLFMNFSFWRYIFSHLVVDGFMVSIFAASLPITLFLALYIFFNFLFWPYITKPLMIVILLISSAANYFMYQYGIYINSDMIRNTFETHPAEAQALITTGLIMWVLILGIIPSLLLFKIKIIYKPFPKELLQRLINFIICLAIVGVMAILTYKNYASFGRNNNNITRLVNPTNYIYSTIKYYKKKALASKKFVELDKDPKLIPFQDDKPTVFILILGETARSMNFSLNGYKRETNPHLKQHDVISFQDVDSAGTATAVSVPSMFSIMGSRKFDADRATYTENVMDLIQKSGYQVLWKENDGGCKGVCNRVPNVVMDLNNPKYCDGKTCYDEILIDDLEDYLKTIKDDTFIILHTIGSHGPTYYKRYPDKFKKFKPTCDTAEIQNCTQEEIINTYDNTILYTDEVVAKTIDILQKFPKYEAGLLYISDHGESLGENNIYLHGLPYKIAPEEQRKVPAILWMSNVMKKYDYVDYECMKKLAHTQTVSHDYLFHSLLSLLEIHTEVYNPKLDFFKECRTKDMPKPKTTQGPNK